jgi:hypothetical protein
MAKDYTPKVGDLVTAQGQNSIVLKVLSVSDSGTAELRPFLIGKQQLFGTVVKVPRVFLAPYKEDSSQAAARIVREATQDK